MKAAKYTIFTIILLSTIHYSNASNKRKFSQLINKDINTKDDDADNGINEKLKSMVNFKEVFKKATKITPNGKSTTFNIKNALNDIAKKISEKLTYRDYQLKVNNQYKYSWSKLIHKKLREYQQKNDKRALNESTKKLIDDLKKNKFEEIYNTHKQSIKDVLSKHYGIDHEKYNTDKKQARKKDIQESWGLLLNTELERIKEQNNPKKICNASEEEVINYLNSKLFFNDYTTKKDQFKKFFIEKYNLVNNFFKSYKNNKKPWAQLLVKKIEKLASTIDPFKEKIDIFLNNILTNKGIENSLNYSSMQKFYTTFSFTESDVAILRKRLSQLWKEHPKKKVIYDKIWKNINKNRIEKTAEIVRTALTNKKEKRNIHENYLKNNENIPNVIIRAPIDFTDRYIRRPKYQSKNIKQSNNLNEMIEKPIQNNDNNLKDNHYPQLFEEESIENNKNAKNNYIQSDCSQMEESNYQENGFPSSNNNSREKNEEEKEEEEESLTQKIELLQQQYYFNAFQIKK